VEAADHIVTTAVGEIVAANRGQLSLYDTLNFLTYRVDPSLSRLALDEHVDRAAAEQTLQNWVLELSTVQMERRLRLIVENLNVDGEIPQFFGVQLTRVSDDERQTLYDDALIPNPRTSALGFAELNAPGDQSWAFDWGIRQVEQFLNLLRGCGGLGSFHPVRIMGRNPVVDEPVIQQQTAQGWHTTARTAYGNSQVSFARVRGDLLAAFSQAQIDQLVAATTGNCSKMFSAVVGSLETIGEAWKPHLVTSRIMMVSSALEMMVGARTSDDVAFRGQTAAIAERATFLAGGNTLDARREFDKRVRKVYGLGSGVRHGDRPNVSDADVIELATITRQVAQALLDRPDIGTPQDLDAWVQTLRYTTEP
jgi:hypothetical protein